MQTQAIVVGPGAGSGPGPAELVTVDLAEPLPHEVVVEVAATGICHTDVSWARGHITGEYPVVLGHETSGTIVARGSYVSELHVGDRVVIGLAHNCGRCSYCATGHPMLCAQRVVEHPRLSRGDASLLQGFGVGGFARHVVVAAGSCVRIPDAVPFEIAAVVGCAVATGIGAALNIAQVDAGSRVLIFGGGGIGSALVMGCALAGAEEIMVVDPIPQARAAARRLGATGAVCADAAQLSAVLDGEWDFVFESVGAIAPMEQAIAAARRGGVITLIGAPNQQARLHLPAYDFVVAQKTLHGCLTGDVNPPIDFDRYFRLYERGKLPLAHLIGERVSLSVAADQLNGKRDLGSGRTMICPADLTERSG